MNKRYWLIVTVTILMAVSLIFSACAKPAPAPTPTPTPTPAPAPAKHPEVNLEFYSPPKGTTIYQMVFAFADIINKNHPWLRAQAVETHGGQDALYTMEGLPPERRVLSLTPTLGSEKVRAENAIIPYTKKITGLKHVMRYTGSGNPIVTNDPKIKTYKDLIGKRVGTWARSSGNSVWSDFIMKECWGIYDQCEVKYMGLGDLKNALVDGMVDAAFLPVAEGEFQKTYNMSGITKAAFAARKLYWIPITKEAQEKGMAQSYHKVTPIVYKKGILGDGEPPFDLPTTLQYATWVCWHDADSEVITEILKTFAANIDKFEEYLPAAKGTFTKESMAYSAYISEDTLHPAALKYYKDNNIKIGQ